MSNARLIVSAFPLRDDGTTGDAVVELDLTAPQWSLCHSVGIALVNAALEHGLLDVTIEVRR